MRPGTTFNLRNRRLIGELMDEPGLDAREHLQALRGLQRINTITNSTRILWNAIEQLAVRLKRPINVLDIACGGGDVLIDLARRAGRAGLPMQFTGWDLSPTAIERTNSLADQRDVSLQTTVADALHSELPQDQDVIFCSLFLHHLSTQDAERFLQRVSRAVRELLLVSDLLRSRIGYSMAWLGTRVLSRSPIVHTDGPRSVEAAFTLAEMQDLSDRCGLETATVRPFWPQRFLLSWTPDRGQIDG